MRYWSAGCPSPLGATFHAPDMWNFAVYCPHTVLELVIGEYTTGAITASFPLDPTVNRTGDIWHIAIKAHDDTLLWGWRIGACHAPQGSKIAPIAVDPYAKLVQTGSLWGQNAWASVAQEGVLVGVATADTEFSWGTTVHSPLKPEQLIIYEAHVRGMSIDPSSNSRFPGTYLGMIDALPHLQALGITALELLPIFEFDEMEWPLHNPITGSRLYNYWGYSPLSFFSPMQRYGTTNDPKTTAKEFKALVRACHDCGIAVILDVVYNHTGEGNEHGPGISLKLLGNDTYYIMNDDDSFANFSGCGNTVNANHPVAIDLILHSLRHWILEYRVDGFRFDLASAMTRNQLGIPMTEPSLIEAIILDPVIGKSILITEPWDAAGLYQTGRLFHLNQCQRPALMEWNDRFRDDVRRFVRGTPGMSGLFASRMCGSEDIYGPLGSPANSINYISAHDGFSLCDLVSYNEKHNSENGERNLDGMNENYSWNCGVEGPTPQRKIARLRDRQCKNFLTALLMSQGNPMILMGDEYARSKGGNNNTWCQDSPISWYQWHEVEQRADLVQLVSTLSALRKESGCFHSHRFLTEADVQWHGNAVDTPCWDSDNHLVVWTLCDQEQQRRLFIAFNASPRRQRIEIPRTTCGAWQCVVNTSKLPPDDLFPLHQGPRITTRTITMMPFSSLVLSHL